MPEPTLLSPNTGNLQVGKGIVSFKKEGEDDYRDLGNVSEMVLTPDMTTLEHYSSREGTKKKDLVIILEKKASLKVTMEEFTAYNLSIMLMGSVDETAVGGPRVEIFDQAAVSGTLKFVGTNEVGPRQTMELWNVTFTPTGDLNFISDEWGNMEATADVLTSGGVPPVYAHGVYTASALADGDTLVIGGKTYTLEASLTNVDGHVKVGASLTETLANIRKAINLSGTAGTDYAAATTKHGTVTGTASDATTLTVTAITPVAATGNAITTTDTATGGAWGGATLAGGVDGDVNAGKFGYTQITNIAA